MPGLGSIMLSFVSAAAAAVVGRRVLQVENWTAAAASLGAPCGTPARDVGLAPHVRAQGAASRSTWAAHDDSSGFDDRADLRASRRRASAHLLEPVLLPLLLLNAHHARPLAAMGGNGNLWGPALAAVRRSAAADAAAAYVARGPRPRQRARRRHPRALAARQRGTPRAFSAARGLGCAAGRGALPRRWRGGRAAAAGGLRRDGVRVEWYGDAVGVQGETRARLDAAVLDLWLLGTAGLLVSRARPSRTWRTASPAAPPPFTASHTTRTRGTAASAGARACRRAVLTCSAARLAPACRAGVAAGALPLYAASRHVY